MTSTKFVAKHFAVDLADIVVILVEGTTIQLTNKSGVTFNIYCFDNYSAEMLFKDITNKWANIKNET